MGAEQGAYGKFMFSRDNCRGGGDGSDYFKAGNAFSIIQRRNNKESLST